MLLFGTELLKCFIERILLCLTQTRILWAARDLQELFAAARYPCVELLLRDADVRAGGPERGPAGLANVRRGFVLSDARLSKPEAVSTLLVVGLRRLRIMSAGSTCSATALPRGKALSSTEAAASEARPAG